MRVSGVLQRVPVVEGLAHVTRVAHGVVLTVITHAPAHVPGGQKHGRVEVAGVGVAVAVTLWQGEKP